MLSRREITEFRRRVWDFYTTHARRELPWRKQITPYRVLVSEVMLQQTQVDRVIPYFERWVRAFPSLAKLAKAPTKQILSLWSGLGYNRRALYLQQAAQLLHANSRGRIPPDPQALQELPGIGPYTAAAIAAFAFEVPTVVLETNIRAVYLHHFFPEAQTKTVPDAELVPLIEQTMEKEKVRWWYYALMDYGAFLKRTQQNPTRKSRLWQRQSPFEGSFRQLRGAVLKAVLAGAEPDPQKLARQLNKDPKTVARALNALQKEGFLSY